MKTLTELEYYTEKVDRLERERAYTEEILQGLLYEQKAAKKILVKLKEKEEKHEKND